MESLKQILDNLRSQWPEPTHPLNCVAMPVDEADRNDVQRSQSRWLAALNTGKPKRARAVMQNEELRGTLGEEKRSPKGCFLRSLSDVSDDFPMAVVKGRGDLL